MTCAACGHENRDTAKFCEECAAAMERRCTACGAQLRPTSKFCDECAAPAAPSAREPLAYTPKHLAEKILASKSALEGERKQVTVLFADVKGSLELAEQVDPEEWHRILDRFFAILAEGVHRFEGTVNQYTGDGIMALFGAPIAHEDHAQRACWAALHLQDAVRGYADELRRRGFNFSVRMGLNSGEVVVGRIGDDLRMDYTAQGHTVGLAQRMEQLAEVGRVYLTEHSAALVAGYFRLRDLGAFEVKGVRERVGVYELEGAGALRTRLDLSRARGFSRFVGRADEMTALEAALARALEGDGQVVGVVADAGIGKSRLCFEFLEHCRARGIVTYRASGVAYGKSVPLVPVLELLRDYYGITAADSAAIAREKIAGRLLLLDRAFDDVLPVVFDFLGVGDPERPVPAMEPEARQRRMFELIRRVIQLRGQREPTVTLIEDLHWFDSGSDAFLAPLVEARAGTRALLVLNFRPEYRADWMQKSYYQQLPLRPLGAEATDELLRELLGADPSLDGLGTRIRERTAGNPFFIEEVVRSLEETGTLVGPRGACRLARPVDAIAVPATVQAVLAARIDRLAEREKTVLQTAAVIGQEFGEGLLRRVAGLIELDLAAALRTLVAAEFLYASALFPEGRYTFTHPLTQEVAYGSQLGERRARVHAAVAAAMEDDDPAPLDERAALLAHHWEAAGDALRAARWHRRAATWLRRSDFAEARRHLERVRALVAELPDSPERAELGATACAQLLYLASRMGLPEDEATAVFEEGKAWAEATDNARLRSAVLANFARFRALGLGDGRSSVARSEEALRLATEADDREARLFVQALLIAWLYLVGRPRDGLALAEATLELAAGDTAAGADLLGFSPYILALALRGVCGHVLGHIEEGERDAEQAVALAARQPSADLVGSSHYFAAAIAFARGDAGACTRHALAVLDVAAKVGIPAQEVLGLNALGCTHIVGANWREAVAALERALEIMRRHRIGLYAEALTLDRLAEAYLGAGETGRARAAVDEAIAVAERRGTIGWGYRGPVTLARVLLASSGAAARSAVEAALATAQAQVDQSGERVHQPFIHLARAELATALGDAAGRQRALGEAHRLFTEMGATARAERLAKELGV